MVHNIYGTEFTNISSCYPTVNLLSQVTSNLQVYSIVLAIFIEGETADIDGKCNVNYFSLTLSKTH